MRSHHCSCPTLLLPTEAPSHHCSSPGRHPAWAQARDSLGSDGQRLHRGWGDELGGARSRRPSIGCSEGRGRTALGRSVFSDSFREGSNAREREEEEARGSIGKLVFFIFSGIKLAPKSHKCISMDCTYFIMAKE